MPTAGSGRYLWKKVPAISLPSSHLLVVISLTNYLLVFPCTRTFSAMNECILEGQQGILCHMDDVLVFGQNQEEHDSRLHQTLMYIQKAGLTLNSKKCEFSKPSLTFLGHVIDKHGVSADPSRTAAILKMEESRSVTVTELRRLWEWSISLESSALPQLRFPSLYVSF